MTLDQIKRRIDAAGANLLVMSEANCLLTALAECAWNDREYCLSAWLEDMAATFNRMFILSEDRADIQRRRLALRQLAGDLHTDTDGPEICRLAARVLEPWGRS